MRNILEALAKWKSPPTARSVLVDHDDKTDEYTVRIRLKKSTGSLATAVYRIGYREMMVTTPEKILYWIIDACEAALNAPGPVAEPASPEPVVHPHPKKHGGDGPKAA